jgi:hypothetical protein
MSITIEPSRMTGALKALALISPHDVTAQMGAGGGEDGEFSAILGFDPDEAAHRKCLPTVFDDLIDQHFHLARLEITDIPELDPLVTATLQGWGDDVGHCGHASEDGRRSKKPNSLHKTPPIRSAYLRHTHASRLRLRASFRRNVPYPSRPAQASQAPMAR